MHACNKDNYRICTDFKFQLIEMSNNIKAQGRSWGGGGTWGARAPPLGRLSYEQTTYDFTGEKTAGQYLGRKSHC